MERTIARLARAAHGVVTRSELLAAGITAREIDGRIAKGLLLIVHRGVYRVGHQAPSVEARYVAAVKACGDGAVLSGPAAAHLWGILRGPAPQPSVTARTERHVRGVMVTRSKAAPEATKHRGIPVTTVPRTLVDLAALLDVAELARACHEAGVRYRTTPRQVEAVLGARPGARRLRAVLRGDTPVSLSRLEQAFLSLLDEAGLPRPVTNRPSGAKRVDCRWPLCGLTVELDSYRFHNSRHAWEQDRGRDREARARGDELLRFTYADVIDRPGEVAASLEPRLRAASRTSGARPALR